MKKIQIKVCMGSSCFSRGNNKTVEVIEKFIEENKDKIPIEIELYGTLCMNECAKGPVVIINGKEYFGVTPESIIDLLRFYTRRENHAE